MKVLIVEDNKDLCEIYETTLKALGAQVFIENNGLSAITTIADIQPDLVLLDLLMPELDGFDFLEALRDNVSLNTRVVVASNLSSEGDIERAKELGVVGYLKKSDYASTELVNEAVMLYRKSLL